MGLDVSDDDEEGAGDEDEKPKGGPSRPIQQDIEFEDDDQLATVTIMDDFDPSALTVVPEADRGSPAVEHSTETKAKVKLPNLPASSKRAAQKIKRDKAAKEEKKKSRSMETKSERKFGRAMEAKRRVKKAGMAMERDGKSRGRPSSRGTQKKGRK
jgi:ribosomal RNA-processing protein 17